MMTIKLTEKEVEAITLLGAIPFYSTASALEEYFGVNAVAETILNFGGLVRRITERNKEAAGK